MLDKMYFLLANLFSVWYYYSMATMIIDSYKIVSGLKSKGFSEDQAYGITEAIQQIDMEQMASKTFLQSELHRTKYEILKWMFGGFLAMTTINASFFLTILSRLPG